MTWYRIVQFLLLALGIIIGASRFRLLSKSSRWYLILLSFTFLTELTSWWLGRVYGNNVVVSRVFLPVQFILIAVAYREELVNYSLALLLSVLLVMLISLVSGFIQRHVLLDEYPALVKVICNILIVIWSLVYLRALLNQPTVFSFTGYPLFWISIGWLIFTIVTYFGFSAFNFIYAQNPSFISFFLYLRIIANFSLYTLIAKALLGQQRYLSTLINEG